MSRLSAAEMASRLEDEISGLTIELAEPLPARVTEGPHDALITNIRSMELRRWKRSCLFFTFKIQELGPAHGIILHGFVNLGSNDRNQKTKPSVSSKLARWWRIIADHTGGRRDRVTLAEFKKFLFQIIVTNVRTDNREQDIPQAAQGQIVSEIAAIVQELGTGQPAAKAAQGYPAFIKGLGPLKADGVDRCEQCSELTPFAYGCRRFCRVHAQLQVGGAE